MMRNYVSKCMYIYPKHMHWSRKVEKDVLPRSLIIYLANMKISICLPDEERNTKQKGKSSMTL